MRKTLSLFLLGLGAVTAAPLQKQTIAEGLHDPMALDVASDGDLYVVEREGRVLRVHPDTGGVFEIGEIAVSALRASEPKSDSAVEDGLQGIALDPDFKNNSRIFLYYSHPQQRVDRLARFQLRDGKLDPASELVLLDIPLERDNRVCHHGGSIRFDSDGLLYLSVGDNTNPFASDGYAPIDNRADRTEWDAQRSAGNTNDLRGKILRIRPTETGYTIPPGNLFPAGTAKTRPEIYIMGCRNPFRTSIDPKTHTLYWGEVGPDADKGTAKGPAGYDEINQAKAAGNFGWPFVIANNQPYPVLDFTTGKPVSMTNPAAPINPGRRNTGLTTLPPAQPAFIWYPYDASKEFPSLGKSGRCAMAGPVVDYDPNRPYNLLTANHGRCLLTYDWSRGKIWMAQLSTDEKLQSLSLLDEGLSHPMDLKLAADGSLWMIDYGTDWWFNTNGKIIHLFPSSTQLGPKVSIEPVAESDRSFTVKSDNSSLTFNWWLTTGATERHLGSGGTLTLPPDTVGSELRAVASDGESPNIVARISLVKAKTHPELHLKFDGKAKAFSFGESIGFKITADPQPDPAQLTVRARYIPATGHDASGPQFPADIQSLITANACYACHQVDHTSIGPAYSSVSLKYRNTAGAIDTLKAKVKMGGKGVWGEIPMPPQVALSDGDADTILNAILHLADGVSEIKGCSAGTLQLPARPATATPSGAWEFSAEAPGYTPAKFRIPLQ